MNSASPGKPVAKVELDEVQRNQFIDWRLSGLSFDEIKTKLKNTFGIAVPSVKTVKLLWRRLSKDVAPWQWLRPSNISALGWEISRREALKKLEDPRTPFEQRKSIIIFLETGRYHKPAPVHLKNARENSAPASTENKPSVEMENPLDDDAKLEEVRLLLFGPNPYGEPVPDSSDTPASTESADGASRTNA
jgi:hypothetical protein